MVSTHPPINDSSLFESVTQAQTSRWKVLFSFSLLTLSNSWLWITYSPIEAKVAELWDVSTSHINSLSTVFMFTYVLFGFPALWLLDRVGLRSGLLLGGFLNFIGSLLRVFGTLPNLQGFIFSYIGSFLAALGQLFTLAIPPLLATSWFGPNERSTASAVGVVANQCGTALGLGITGLVVKSTKTDLFSYLCIQAGFAGLALIFIGIFVQDFPLNLPSVASRSSHASHTSHDFAVEVTPKTSWKSYSITVTSLLGNQAILLLAIAYG